MATSNIPVTPGTGGKAVATYSISEDAITKDVARTVVSNSAGAELGTSTNPLGVTQQTLVAGENLTTNRLNNEPVYSFATITSATTTTVKSGAGTVHSINILGGTLGAITVYDNTAGSGTTIVPTVTPTSTLPCPTILLDESFATGLTVVTAAATIINIAFR